MRTLTETLEAAQQASSLSPIIKVTLTHSTTTHIYEQDRILPINHEEQPYTQSAEVTLDNSDGVLTALDLKGFKAIISYGLVTGAGAEYSDTPPLWVVHQELNSSPGRLTCELRMVGIPNMMAEDRAIDDYIPDEDDTKTVKTLLTGILDGTLHIDDNYPFIFCPAYEVVFDSEDNLIDSYKPKDGFRIYVNSSRMAAIRQLLDYTHCVMRAEADGKIHIFKPTITGGTFDYEYSLEAGHTFFAKAYRKTLVIPNYILVESQEGDDPQYSGFAKDQQSIDALYEVRQYERCRLESDAQAEDIAEAILGKYQLNAEMGAAEVPMNVGAEVFDYVMVTDARESDYRQGNIGSITRTYKPGQYSMRFSFGGWLSIRALWSNLEVYPGSSAIGSGSFEKLYAKDGYIENLSIDQIKAIWLDPDSNIDLDKIGDTLDNLPDGENYLRVSSFNLAVDEDPESPHYGLWVLKLDENILYQPGYDPTDKFDLGGNNLDDIPEGVTYQRTKSSALTPNGLVILDEVWVDWDGGDYGLALRSDFQAGKIKLSSLYQTSGYRTVTDAQKAQWEAARDDIIDMADDSKVTPVEKIKAKQEWEAIVGEKADIDSKADELEVSRVAYDAAYTALNAYLNTTLHVFDNMNATTAITRTTWKSKWNTYYDEKVKMLTELGKAGYTYAAEAYFIAIDAIEGKITVCHDTDFDGVWYEESGVEISAVDGIIIAGGKLTLKDSDWQHSAQLYIDTDGKLRLDGWAQIRSKSICPIDDGTRVLGLEDLRWYLFHVKSIYLYDNLHMESGSRVMGDLIPYSDGGSDLGKTTKVFSLGYIDNIYSYYIKSIDPGYGYVGTSSAAFYKMYAEQFVETTPPPIMDSLAKLKNIKHDGKKFDKASFPAEIFRSGEADKEEFISRAQSKASKLEKAARDKTLTSEQQQRLLDKAAQVRLEAQEEAGKVTQDGLELGNWCSMLHGGLQELLQRVEALEAG